MSPIPGVSLRSLVEHMVGAVQDEFDGALGVVVILIDQRSGAVIPGRLECVAAANVPRTASIDVLHRTAMALEAGEHNPTTSSVVVGQG